MRRLWKYSTILLLLFFFAFQVSPLLALELDLDVEEDLEEFIQGYQLSQLEIDELSDPFLDFRPPEPEEPEVTEEPEIAEEEEELEEEIIERPAFTVNGLVSRGGELLAVVEHADSVEILRQGQSLNDYVFSHRVNNSIVFVKEGEQFEFFVGEDENR